VTPRDSLRQLEQRIRPDFRRSVVFGGLGLVALVAGSEFGDVHDGRRKVLIAYGCALITLVFGVIATRTAAREVYHDVNARAGAGVATPLRLLVQLGGYLLTAFAVVDLIDVGLQHLLLGSAVAGVVLGLAAQPVLSNLFAGLVLLFSRPYVPGQRIRVMSGAINGPHVGEVVAAGLLYTTLATDDGPLNIPNSALMAAAVGPAPDDAAPGGADPPPPDATGPGAAATIAVAEQVVEPDGSR
jgi:small-conductance mechanosensitive channel